MRSWKPLLALAIAFPLWTQALPAHSHPLPASIPAVMVAEAKTVVLEDAGLQLQLPEGWVSSKDDDGYNLHPADKSMAILVRVCSPEESQKFVEALKSVQAKKFKDIKAQDPQKDTINGIPYTCEAGEGTMDGEPIFWSIDVVQGTQPAVFYSVISKKSIEVHGDEYKALVQSIRKK